MTCKACLGSDLIETDGVTIQCPEPHPRTPIRSALRKAWMRVWRGFMADAETSAHLDALDRQLRSEGL